MRKVEPGSQSGVEDGLPGAYAYSPAVRLDPDAVFVSFQTQSPP
jgi:hypothetical protein